MHQFTVVEAVQQVAVILFEHVFARAVFVVGLLYAAPCGGVVACHGEAYHRAVGQVDGALHESLAEGAAADDYAAIPVLDGSGDDFAGRGRVFVYQYDEASVGEASVALCQEVASPFGASFGVDNEFFLSQELVGQVDGGVEVASAVALQVEDEVFHAFAFELFESVGKFVKGGRAEIINAHVADVFGIHVDGVDAVYGNLVARDDEVQGLADAAAQHAEVDLAAFRSAQSACDFVRAHFHAGDGRVVDGYDAVARQDACFFGRPAGHGLDDHECVFVHVELYADSFEVPLKRFIEFFHLFRVGVGGVRVELAQHLDDGALDQFVFIHGVHVELLDGEFGYLQLACRCEVEVFGLLCLASDGYQEQTCGQNLSHHNIVYYMWLCS